MDYEEYIKGKYMKMALKGIRIPFSEDWEKAIVAVQCLFTVNSTMNNNALKLINAIPEAFMDKFEKAQPIELDADSHKYVELLLRVQNYMRTINTVSRTYIPQLIDIIIKNRASIDAGLYKYFLGNRSVLENYAETAQEQVKAIDNSLNESFKSNSGEIDGIRKGMSETFVKTQEDINVILDKINTTLDLQRILKVEL